MRCVIPNVLWIGNARDARDVRTVLGFEITTVIDLAIEEPPITFPRDICYCRFPLHDSNDNARPLLINAIRTTATLIAERSPTMIACSMGMSRSPAIASAALAIAHDMTLDEAISMILQSGPCDISPALFSDLQAIFREIRSAS